MTYSIGDRIVYPLHGAGVISSIEEKEVMGEIKQYYYLELPFGNTVVMIPVDNVSMNGVREIIDQDELPKILGHMKDSFIECNKNWNKRHRENLERLKSGDIYEVIDVYKSLICRDNEKGLSMGEKKMLSNSRNILYSELMLSSGKDEEEIEALVSEFMGLEDLKDEEEIEDEGK